MRVIMSKRPASTSPLVSRNMKKVRVRDTEDELAVRRLLYTMGYRYRVQYRPRFPDIGRSSIDISFPGRRVAVFIDGCFWHGCPKHGTVPKANSEWWQNKLSENKASDLRVATALKENGWTVLRFWTHEEPESIAERIAKVVSDANRQSLRRGFSPAENLEEPNG